MILLLVFIFAFGFTYGIGIEDALRIAKENNRELLSVRALLEGYRGRVISAEAFPNPSLSLETMNISSRRGEDKPLYSFGFMQDIPLWGVRGKAVSKAEKEMEAFKYEIEIKERELLADVYKSFYITLYAKSRVLLLKENLKILEDLEDYIKTAYDLGEATELEILRIKREKDILEAKLKIEEANYRAKLKELSSLLGKEVDLVEGNMEDIPPLRSINMEELPHIRAIKLKMEAVDKAIELERALSKPTLSVGLTAEDSQEGFYEYRIALESTLPLFYRRKGEIIENISLKESLSKELENRKILIEALLSSIRERYRTIIEQVKRIDEDTVKSAKRELEIGIVAYKDRVISLFELSNIRESYYKLLMERLDMLKELHLVVGEFISLGGWKK